MSLALDCVAVIPARGGSKRIPSKNIVPLGGKPLIVHTLKAVLDVIAREDVFVSTDSPEIAAVAGSLSVGVIMRPPDLASDSASTENVLLHALDVLAEGGRRPEWIMTLPPTSPFRGASAIRKVLKECETSGRDADAFFTVTENRGDFWVGESVKALSRLFPDAPRRQQERQPLWEENSAIYMTRVDVLRQTGFILGRKHCGVLISAIEAFDINTPMDFKIAQCILESGQKPE